MTEATLSPATIDAIVNGFAPLRVRAVGHEHVITRAIRVRTHLRHAPCSCVTILARAETGPIDVGDQGDIFDVQLIEAGRGDHWELIFVRPMPRIALRSADTFTFTYALTLRPEECHTDHASGIDPMRIT